MIISIPAHLAAAVSHAISTEETRYYLTGLHITQRRIEATDGHLALCARVEQTVPVDIILPLPRALLMACRKAARKDDGSRLEYDIETMIARVLFGDDAASVHMEQVVPIDGSFPDLSCIFREIADLSDSVVKEERVSPFSPLVLEKIVGAAKDLVLGRRRDYVMPVLLAGRYQQMHVVRFGVEGDNVFGIAMPMRYEMSAALPIWATADC